MWSPRHRDAGVEAPKTSRSSRVHAIWYTSAHAPEASANAMAGTIRPAATRRE